MEMIKVPGPAGTYEVPLHSAALHTRFFQGAGLAAALTVLRMFFAVSTKFTVGQMLFGLVGVSLGGGIGGIVYYATDRLRVRGGVRRTLANVTSLLAYCFATIGLLLFLGPILHVW